jgi:hypothetical protein
MNQSKAIAKTKAIGLHRDEIAKIRVAVVKDMEIVKKGNLTFH